MALSTEDVSAGLAAFSSDPAAQLAQNAVTRNEVNDVRRRRVCVCVCMCACVWVCVGV